MDSGTGTVNMASLGTRAAWARGLLVVYILAELVIMGLIGLSMVTELSLGYSYYGIGIGMAVIQFTYGAAVFALVGVAVVLWVHRVQANLHAMGMQGLHYSPGWSVGCFFVPVINLWVPMRMMRELHNRSMGEDEWQAEASVADVASWWACHVSASFILAYVAVMQFFFNMLTNVKIMAPPGVNLGILMLAVLLLIGAAVFLFRVIGSATRAQKSMAGAVQAFV